MVGQKGQSSIEMMAIVAAGLIILAVLISFTSDQLARLERERALKSAEASVEKIVNNVNEVYAQGSGSTRQILLEWPDGVDASNSSISGKTIRLRVNGTDVVGTTIPTITGSLPTHSQLQVLRIRAQEGFVEIGIVSLSVDPSSVFATINPDENTSAHLSFSNGSGEDANLTFVKDWNHTLVSLLLSDQNKTILAGGNASLDLNFNASVSAIGSFGGGLSIRAQYSSKVETIIVPLTVQVAMSSASDLTTYPGTISISTFGSDTNSTTVQLCNLSTTPIKTISFTPSSGSPGAWIQGIDTISQLDGLSCTPLTLYATPPAGTSLGSYSGSLFITDFSGTQSLSIPLTVNVQGMSSYFVWDWSPATIATAGISGFRVANAGTKPVQVDQMIIRNWGKCDSAHSALTGIFLDGSNKFSGSLSDGNAIDMVDFNIPVLTNWYNNDLTFNGVINDENESFIADVNFSDGTSYTSSEFGGNCGIDVNAPAKVSNLLAVAGPEPGSVRLTFKYPGDDENKGVASQALFRFSKNSITNDSTFNSATNADFIGPFLSGGNDGNFLITDINVGFTYYFAVKFVDENGNQGPLSNVPLGRPWNKFQFLGNDFNFSNMAKSNLITSTSPDVNEFKLANMVTDGSSYRNITIRVVPASANKTWITSLDFNSTDLNRIRIWYPADGYMGIPPIAAQYDSNNSAPISSGIDLLRASLITSNQYRYNGSLISITQPNSFYLDILTGFSDLNVVWDMTDPDQDGEPSFE